MVWYYIEGVAFGISSQMPGGLRLAMKLNDDIFFPNFQKTKRAGANCIKCLVEKPFHSFSVATKKTSLRITLTSSLGKHKALSGSSHLGLKQ